VETRGDHHRQTLLMNRKIGRGRMAYGRCAKRERRRTPTAGRKEGAWQGFAGNRGSTKKLMRSNRKGKRKGTGGGVGSSV